MASCFIFHLRLSARKVWPLLATASGNDVSLLENIYEVLRQFRVVLSVDDRDWWIAVCVVVELKVCLRRGTLEGELWSTQSLSIRAVIGECDVIDDICLCFRNFYHGKVRVSQTRVWSIYRSTKTSTVLNVSQHKTSSVSFRATGLPT